MGVALGRKYSNKMYFIGIVILLTLCPLFTVEACHLSNCLHCNDISVCNVCNDGYYLEAGSCLQCPTNCATCTNSTHCQTCLDTYWLPERQCRWVCNSRCTVAGCNDSTGFCYECIPGMHGKVCSYYCNRCAEGDCDRYECTKGCKDGNTQIKVYRHGILYKPCIPCPFSCILCSNVTYCTQCKQGYYGSYFRLSSGGGIMKCEQCDGRCTECTSTEQCPECPPDCIQQGCGESGNCDTTTPTPTIIKSTSTSKVCRTECTSGCDTQGRCHQTTTKRSESAGSSAASQDMEYHEVFGHGVATGIGVVISILLLIGFACFLIRRTQCIETPCFAKTTTTSKEQHVYYNTQTEMGSTSNPRNTPEYVNADNVPPGQDSEYEINEAGEYSSLDERQLENQYSDLQG